MTYEEAIDILKNEFKLCDPNCTESCTRCLEKAFELAIEALEKQIPKKPIIDMCPCCENLVAYRVYDDTVDGSEVQDSFCGFCGQAIDWSEG